MRLEEASNTEFIVVRAILVAAINGHKRKLCNMKHRRRLS